MIDDNFIIDFFIDKKRNKIIESHVNDKYMSKHVDIRNYLINRYDSFRGYSEVISRIYHNIENVPKCRYCGKQLKYKNFKTPYGIWCDCKCQLKDPTFIEWRSNSVDYKQAAKKYKKTCIDKYGVPNPSMLKENRDKARKTLKEHYGVEYSFQSEELIEKGRKTKLERYGDENYCNVDKIKQTKSERYGDPGYTNKDKARKTMKKRYGVEYTLQSEELVKKGRQTKLERYGDENYTNRKKCEETMLEKYGVKNSFQLKEYRDKIDYQKGIETKRKNGTLNSSKQEEKFYNILLNFFNKDDIEKQYKDTRYSNDGKCFLCDFYIKSKDLFIELNGHFTHGKHPYDSNDKNDIELLEMIREKSKTKKIYKIFEIVWTKRDVLKRKCAKQNNLNYIEVFGCNFTEDSIKECLNKYI
jgi:hypothetical protein